MKSTTNTYRKSKIRPSEHAMRHHLDLTMAEVALLIGSAEEAGAEALRAAEGVR